MKVFTTWQSLIIIILLAVGFCSYANASQERELLSPDVLVAMHNNIINPIAPHLVFTNPQQANIWLNDMSNRLKKWIPDEFLRKRYLTIIQYEASRAGLDPQIVLSLITVESKFNKYAISSTGARGMMQVMPFWVAQIGDSSQDLFDIETNIRYGCTILRYYLKEENGNLRLALERYNGSLGQDTYPNLVMASYNAYWNLYPVATLNNNQLKIITYNTN